MKIKTPKEKLNLNLSREAKVKAKTFAAQMGVSVSYFIEGLIMGVQFVPGEEQEKN